MFVEVTLSVDGDTSGTVRQGMTKHFCLDPDGRTVGCYRKVMTKIMPSFEERERR